MLGAPYGGPIGGKDLQGDSFGPETEFGIRVGDFVPVYINHSEDAMFPEIVGRATASRRDAKGLWFRVTLDKAKQTAVSLFEAATKGLLAASSGAINYLVRRTKDGRVLNWPIGELSLVPLGGHIALVNSVRHRKARQGATGGL